METHQTMRNAAAGGQEKKVKMSLGWKMAMVAIIPMTLLIVIIVVYTAKILTDGMRTEAVNGMAQLANSIEAAYEHIDSGDYYLNESGELMKGELNISQGMETLDSFVEGFSTDVTVFYGDTRMATTLISKDNGERIVGTTASAEVVDTVLRKGQTYTAYDLFLNGEDYYVYYQPLKNHDGSIVGMVFVGIQSKDIDSFITEELMKIVGTAIAVMIVAIIAVTLFCRVIVKILGRAKDIVNTIENGDMTVRIDSKMLDRKDEMGVIMYTMENLIERLAGVLQNIQNSAGSVHQHGEDLESMATQTSATADEIARAVGDISRGAVTQAEDTEQATAVILEMGKVIQNIVQKIEHLSHTADQMKEAGDEANKIVTELSASNDKTTAAVARVAETIRQTDISVQQIQEAVTMISSIASETSLLSLNASIEAARAGEAGRGFAVVAGEIQKLADESDRSAQKIEEVINNLLEDSQRAVRVMGEVNVTMDDQQKKLEETKRRFEKVRVGIASSREDIVQVSAEAANCDEHRSQVVDLIQNLSAVSEENATTSEQTTASMQELNATINQLAQSSEVLLNMADELSNATRYFKVN